MRTYSAEFKDSVIRKMLAPMNRSVPELAQETGIAKDTLYTWRIQYRRANGVGVAANDKTPAHWSSEDKLAGVVETATLSEVELSEYCRKKGLYPEQVRAWKEAWLRTHSTAVAPSKAERVTSQARAKRIEALETELHRKQKALAEAAALLVLQKSPSALGGARGRMIGLGEREMVIESMDETCAAGARQAEACKVLGLSARIVQRWHEAGPVKADARQMAARVPANKRSEQERQQVLQVVNQGEFQSLPPSQIVSALADRGLYIASESTFYRVLREEGQLKHRGKVKAPTHRVPQATRPALRIRCGAGIVPVPGYL